MAGRTNAKHILGPVVQQIVVPTPYNSKAFLESLVLIDRCVSTSQGNYLMLTMWEMTRITNEADSPVSLSSKEMRT